MAASDPAAKAIAAAERLYKSLNKPVELGHITAAALLDAAQSAAKSRPTPQAPMVAAGFSVADNVITGPRDATLVALVFGSEYGSTRWRQFHGRHPQGSWLFRNLNNPPESVAREQEAWLEKAAD